MPIWDADLYLRFAKERTQPSLDLISRIRVVEPKRIIDLGCGPGNSTAALWSRWPEARVIGLDSSPEMIASASSSYPDREWQLADVGSWSVDEPFDIVFSNATLQWLHDHAHLFPHLLEQVAPGGALAVQMPNQFYSPLYEVVLAVADETEWEQQMADARQRMTHESAPFYYDTLSPFSSHLEIWETQYYHVLENVEAILDWFRGTGLRPFLEALDNEAQREKFEALVLQGLRQSYFPQGDGRVLFPFRRLFMVAYR